MIMVSAPRYFYRKADKLKSRKQIELVFKKGKTFMAFPLKIHWYADKSAHAVLQAAVSVPSRHFKKAVDRNKIKRIMREAWRLNKNSLQQQTVDLHQNLSVFIVYVGNEVPQYDTLANKTETSINKLKKLMVEAG